MLGKIMGINRELPSWGTLIVALVASQLLIQLPHPHNDTQGLMNHLLAAGFVLIVWSALQRIAESQDRLHTLKHGLVAGLSEAIVLAAAGTVYHTEAASLPYAIPLGWLCALAVLVDHGIQSHARPFAVTDGMLHRLSMGRCLLLLLGIGSHWRNQMTGTTVFSMGTALTLVLAISALGCVRRYWLVARSLRPPRKTEVRPGLEVQP
jgi:uncharacterized membrane protein